MNIYPFHAPPQVTRLGKKKKKKSVWMGHSARLQISKQAYHSIVVKTSENLLLEIEGIFGSRNRNRNQNYNKLE